MCLSLPIAHLSFLYLMFLPAPPPLSHCHLSLSIAPPASCLSVWDAQTFCTTYQTSMRFKRSSHVKTHVNTDLTMPLLNCSKSLHAEVRFTSTCSYMEWAPSHTNGCAFRMGTPVTQPSRNAPITNLLGIRESAACKACQQLACQHVSVSAASNACLQLRRAGSQQLPICWASVREASLRQKHV